MNQEQWYTKAQDYWKSVPATVDGVLGGFSFISDIDCSTNTKFLSSYISNNSLATSRACDCGAGIGRLTKHFLLNIYSNVDLVEQNPLFINQAKEYLSNDSRITNYFTLGLQDFYPEPIYDLIWIQWVLGHLKDDDFVDFFKRCKAAIDKTNGLIGVKENITKSGTDLDEEDSSITRSDAGLTIVKESTQEGFPKSLYPYEDIFH